MTFRQFSAIFGACAVAAATVPGAAARPNVATDSAVFVERARSGEVRRLEPADRVAPGERVVTIVSWYRLGGSGGFTITNPLPRTIAYQASAREDEEVSADGGRTWGRLGELRYGSRLATPEDVTHVRWRVSPNIAALGRGNIAYSGIVR